jgi:DNA-binding NarL/FixJ family response regulator
MTETEPDFEFVMKRCILTGMRAAGIRTTADQDRIVVDTVIPNVRRMMTTNPGRKGVDQRTDQARDLKISPMEYVALVHGARSWTAKQSGEHLGISEDTMKTHRRRLFQRLNTNTMMETVMFALRSGILTWGDVDRDV